MSKNLYNTLYGNPLKKGNGSIGQSLKTCNCFQQNLAGEQIEGPTLSTNCRRWQKCSKCCSNSFGNDWYGEDPISSIIRRR